MQGPIIELMALVSLETMEIRRHIQNTERKNSPLRILQSLKISFKNKNEKKKNQNSWQVDSSYMKF